MISLRVIILINILIVPEPSTTTAQPCIIDLTRSSSPLVGRTSPVHSRTYADVGTSPIPSLLPMNEESSASIRGKYLYFLHGLSNGCWIASSRCGSDSFPPYPGRSLSAQTFGTLFSFFLCSLFTFQCKAQLCRLFMSAFYLTFSNNILMYPDPSFL